MPIPEPYTLVFKQKKRADRPRRYLLRLINTSGDTTFVFSIDHHRMKVIGSDFVAIHPYTTTSILVGIGQVGPPMRAQSPIPF
jgi:FtsP/CotA-like multicopper oxidase with cupredoxin domain